MIELENMQPSYLRSQDNDFYCWSGVRVTEESSLQEGHPTIRAPASSFVDLLNDVISRGNTYGSSAWMRAREKLQEKQERAKLCMIETKK